MGENERVKMHKLQSEVSQTSKLNKEDVIDCSK